MVMVCSCLPVEVLLFDAVKGRPCLLVMGCQSLDELPDLRQHAVGAVLSWESE